jgi:hypothetical protein
VKKCENESARKTKEMAYIRRRYLCFSFRFKKVNTKWRKHAGIKTSPAFRTLIQISAVEGVAVIITPEIPKLHIAPLTMYKKKVLLTRLFLFFK